MKTKLFIWLFAVLTLSSCACHNFGVKGGLNVASITGDDTDNLDARIGAYFGGFAELCVTNNFAVQPEIIYSMQGAEYTDSEEDGISYDGKFKLDYLNVPVVGKVKITEGLLFEAGPQIGFLLSAKDEYESPGDSGEDDIKDDVKGVDFAGVVGLNYQFEEGFNFGVRYNFGLSDIPDSDDFDVNWKNGVFQVGIGYRF